MKNETERNKLMDQSVILFTKKFGKNSQIENQFAKIDNILGN